MSESETDGRWQTEISRVGQRRKVALTHWVRCLLLISVVFNFRAELCEKRLRELMTKTLRQRQWKCERSSAVRNVNTWREKEEINMTKKFACMHRNDHQYKISRLFSNDEDDEGMWWRC